MRMENGPEQISLALVKGAEKHDVMLEFIKPGEPTQNAFIARLNGTYRIEILDLYLFRTLNEAREITERWMNEYNSERPHESLKTKCPMKFIRRFADRKLSIYIRTSHCDPAMTKLDVISKLIRVYYN